MIDGATVLGIDFGERWVGLAISEGSLASPLKILKVKDKQTTVKEITDLCQKESIRKIILGLPQGKQEKEVRLFAKMLREDGREIIFWNEVLTSATALDKMIASGKKQKDRQRLDHISAALILQEYLDSPCPKEN